MSTRATLRSLIERRMGERYPLPTGTIDSQSATITLIDAARDEADDTHNNCYLYLEAPTGTTAPHGEEQLITDFVSSTGTFTVSPGFTTAGGAGYSYWIRRKASKKDYDDAINMAIKRAADGFMEEKVDKTTIICYEDQLEYSLPSDLEVLYRLDLEQCDIVSSGTATATSATTLSDSSKSWTVDGYNTYYAVVITDATGQGQQKTITDTTATQLTVSTWTTTPDTTSKYIVKYTAQEENRWYPILAYDWNSSWDSGVKTSKVHFHSQPTAGLAVRVIYGGPPAELTTDASVCGLPDLYVELQAMSDLHVILAGRIIGKQADAHLQKAAFYAADAQRFKEKVGYSVPWTRMQEESGGVVLPSDYPF